MYTRKCEVREFPDRKKSGPKGKVYVYKQYNDSFAYGEEIVRVFASKDEAEAQLRDDVERTYFGCAWDEIWKKYGFEEGDRLEPDYVSYGTPDGCCFWIVEEHTIE